MLERLQLWIDDVPRDGPSNMAVDEWLLGRASVPVLRVYRWQPGWGSFGYFVKLADARAELPGLRLVRRWTGGGIVDHRSDWTYTLVIPRGGRLAEARGGESYGVIHEAVAEALAEESVAAELAGAGAAARGGACFAQAVEFDVVGAGGVKLAGAGQRRTARGLLHQGSVAVRDPGDRSWRLARCLASAPEPVEWILEESDLAGMLSERYGAANWTERR